MMTKWCVVISDLDEKHFAIVGKFDTRDEVLEFANTLEHGKINIAPFIPAGDWIGKLRTKEMIDTMLKNQEVVRNSYI